MKNILFSFLFLAALDAQAQAPKSFNEAMQPGDSLQLEDAPLTLPILSGQNTGELVVEASHACTLTIVATHSSGDLQNLNSLTLIGGRVFDFGARKVLARPASHQYDLTDIFVRFEISDSRQAVRSIECKVGQSADSSRSIEKQMARGDFDKKLTAAIILQTFWGMNPRLYGNLHGHP